MTLETICSYYYYLITMWRFVPTEHDPWKLPFSHYNANPNCTTMGWIFNSSCPTVPVLPSLLMVVVSGVFFSQPSSCRPWYSTRTWVNVSSMSMGDWRALLHAGYLLPQIFWFNWPEKDKHREDEWISSTEDGNEMANCDLELTSQCRQQEL